MSRLYVWVRSLLLRRQTWALEVFLAVQALAWGVWVAWPGDAFSATLDSYSLLAWAPEWLVGLVAGGHGVAYLLVLAMGGPRSCRRAALATATLWAIVLGSLGLASAVYAAPFAPATPIYAANVGASLWIYLRLYMRFA